MPNLEPKLSLSLLTLPQALAPAALECYGIGRARLAPQVPGDNRRERQCQLPYQGILRRQRKARQERLPWWPVWVRCLDSSTRPFSATAIRSDLARWVGGHATAICLM